MMYKFVVKLLIICKEECATKKQATKGTRNFHQMFMLVFSANDNSFQNTSKF